VTVGREAIWKATGGHPGLVRKCIDLILHDLVTILAEQGKTPNGEDDSPAVLQFLLSHTFFLSLKHTRAVPSSNNFTDTVRTDHSTQSVAHANGKLNR
jgi:hypothetical protein